jgi:hypothetical protein
MRIRHSVRWFSVSVICFLWHPAGASAQGAQLQLDRLSRLADLASNVVDVTVDTAMLQLAAGFISSDKEKDAAIKGLLAGLKGVYVKSFEFERDGVYTEADVNAIREQLKAPWTRMVNVRSKVESVEVYIYREAEKSGGLAVVVVEPRELTVVNIVGPIDLTQLGALGGQLGIPENVGVPRARP